MYYLPTYTLLPRSRKHACTHGWEVLIRDSVSIHGIDLGIAIMLAYLDIFQAATVGLKENNCFDI